MTDPAMTAKEMAAATNVANAFIKKNVPPWAISFIPNQEVNQFIADVVAAIDKVRDSAPAIDKPAMLAATARSSYLDASIPVTDAAACFARSGIKAVGRYYNYGSGRKVLTRHEAQTLVANNIAIWVVFEYYNNDPKWFNVDQAKRDAVRALECAQQLVGQPEGTTIYFGVDYDEDGRNYSSHIAPYFSTLRAVFRRTDGSMPYRIGVYGNGLVCRLLLENGLVTETWLSCSTGHAEHASFYASKKWSLAQTCGVPSVCGVDVDDDEVNVTRADFGQFDQLAALTPSHTAELAAAMLPDFIASANAEEEREYDPAKPAAGEESEVADEATSRVLANLGVPTAQDAAGFRAVALDAGHPATIDLNIGAAQQFLDACVNAEPRVTYGLGAKVPFLGAKPGVDFRRIDCSGFVREAIYVAQHAPLNFPDGSVLQHEWVRARGFAKTDIASGKATDEKVRIAFLRPQDTHSGIGHVVLVYNGKTLESHGGVGPDSRPWTGAGWQSLAYVYVLTA